MTRYVLRKGKLVPTEIAYGGQRGGNMTANIMSDIAPIKSPLAGHPIIDGRAALREELKKNECRIVDPTEWHHGKPIYTNPSFALKRGLPLNGER